ncbi:MAG: CDP-alcohol phosphatidyltransferase [Bacteroidetes bacterium 43-93]|nr:MAG: CDP-alcohol phosphatidyltransferase [Bacteroidetes bacterium 43-93]
MYNMKARDSLQQGIYKVINPFVKFLIKLGLTPNMVTTIGLILNIGVAVIFVFGAETSNRGDMSYVGWAGALVLFAGLFDMLDGQVARLGNMSSTFGALYDSVLDRYSELVMFLGICYYLVSHHYFLSSLFAFIALIGSMMVSYTRARAEGLGIESKGGLMQRPERVVLVGISAIACGIGGHYLGGDYKLFVDGIPFHVFETMSIFTIPITVMAVMTNITALGRLKDAKRALDAKDAKKKPGQRSETMQIIQTAIIALFLFYFVGASASTIDVQDTFPVPKDVAQLMFYIQRTPNTNTICYELNEVAPGVLDEESPIHIFWIRYAEENARRKELNFIQRRFAYGLKVKKTGKDNYDIWSVAYGKKTLHLRKATDNKFYVFTTIDNKMAVLKRIFIKIDGGTFWSPNVVYIELKGTDVLTGNTVMERLKP